jgi:hypothetical protein
VKGKVTPRVKVVTPLVDAALDAPPTEAGKSEAAVLTALAVVFFAILGEGLLVASSGFMSAEMDQLVQTRVLPVFTPTLLVFLAGSSLYGVECHTSFPAAAYTLAQACSSQGG